MHDGSQFIDIILFAMVAVFLGLRLRSVLGRRTGTERPPQAGFARSKPQPSPGPVDVPELSPADGAKGGVNGGLDRIKGADPSFSREGFLQGAGAAFEMIVIAFARGDETTLRPLLSDEVFENFAQAIRARRAAGEICENKLSGIDEMQIMDADLDGRTARVTVRYESRQVIVVRDAKGEIVEGDDSLVHHITDFWRFARDTRHGNPNWLLVATDSRDN
jgi:predicted lipid-binding transport protein (Tim44 family)